MKTCINCGETSDRFFCAECGQKLEVRKVTWRSIADEVTAHWLGFNNQFFRLVRHLTTRPDKVINSYLSGNRVLYIGPVGYLVIMSALYILAFDYLGIDKVQYFETVQEEISLQSLESTESQQMAMAMNQKLAEYMRLLPALNIPFFALGVWIFFRKRGKNYLENIVAFSYLQAHLLWLSILALIVYKFAGSQLTFFWMVPSMAYSTYAITRLYYRKKPIYTAFRSLFSILIGFIFLILASLIIGIVLGLLLVLTGKVEL